jgi:hypothetical protein
MKKEHEYESDNYGYVAPKENLKIHYTHKLTVRDLKGGELFNQGKFTETDSELPAVLLHVLLGAKVPKGRFTWEYYEAREARRIYQAAGLEVPERYALTPCTASRYQDDRGDSDHSGPRAADKVDADLFCSLLGYDPEDRASWECYEAYAARKIYQDAGLEVPTRYALPHHE